VAIDGAGEALALPAALALLVARNPFGHDHTVLLSWHTILPGIIAAMTLPILRKELRLCDSIVHHRRL
jgi:hypothetical protein